MADTSISFGITAGVRGLKKLKPLGFPAACAWHLLVLFTALPDPFGNAVTGRSLSFQFALYISLALSYCICIGTAPLLAKTLTQTKKLLGVLVFVCIGCISGAISIVCTLSSLWSFEFQIATWIVIGFISPLILLPWFCVGQKASNSIDICRNLAFNFGIGAVFAFIVGSMQMPYVFIAFCLLPLISSMAFIPYLKEIQNKDDPNDLPCAQSNNQLRFKPRKALVTNLHFAVYGIVFGLCQFAFSYASSGNTTISFLLSSSWPLLGALLAALTILFIPLQIFHSQGASALQRIGITTFIASIVLAFYFALSADDLGEAWAFVGFIVASALFLGGFIILDFGSLIFLLTWSARLKLPQLAYLSLNRALVYLSMAVGLSLGLTVPLVFPNLPAALAAAAGTGIIALLVINLPACDRFAPYREKMDCKSADTDKPDHQNASAAPYYEKQADQDKTAAKTKSIRGAAWQSRIDYIARKYHLSKREKEVFSYLAQGRNTAYIQKELWISVHTVKTHTANIYHKLDVHSLQEVLDMIDGPVEKNSEEQSQ